MKRCSEKAYAKCPDRALCGTLEEAVFMENSECAEYNRTVEDIPMTNADIIRTMNDEQLAMVIMCPEGMNDMPCSGEEGSSCLDCCLRWLKQPVEEDKSC